MIDKYKQAFQEEAREILLELRQSDYDLVLMDCEMPHMDGMETTRCIRGASSGVRNPNIPIIALTAHAMHGDRERCVAAGMNEYLSKPIEPEQLAELLPKWLRPQPTPHDTVNLPPAHSPTVEQVAFDEHAFVARLSGDKALARDIVAGFLSDVPSQLQILKQQIGQGDLNRAGMQAHTLLGAASTVSASALGELCRQIQRAAKEADSSRAARLLPLLDEEFERLKATLH